MQESTKKNLKLAGILLIIVLCIAGLSVGLYFLLVHLGVIHVSKNESSSTCSSTIATYTAFSDCTNGVKTRRKTYPGCNRPDEIESISCNCDIVYNSWTPSDGSCIYGETQSRTVVTTGSNCATAGTVTETKTCTTMQQQRNG